MKALASNSAWRTADSRESPTTAVDEELGLHQRLEKQYLQRHEQDNAVAWYAANQDLFECRAYGHERTAARAAWAKELTNRVVAKAAANTALLAGAEPAHDRVLVLDGSEACSTRSLLAEGFRPQNILAPNVAPAVVDKLRKHGVTAWAGSVEEYLRVLPVNARPLRLIYLDHTGSVPRHAKLLRQALASSAVGPGSVVAATFSTKRGPRRLPRAWSPAHAMHAVIGILAHCARAKGLELEGTGAGELADYLYCRPRLRKGPPTSPGTVAAAGHDAPDLTGTISAALAAGDAGAGPTAGSTLPAAHVPPFRSLAGTGPRRLGRGGAFRGERFGEQRAGQACDQRLRRRAVVAGSGARAR